MQLTKVVSFCLGDIPSARIGIVEPMLELQREGLIEFTFYLAAQLTQEILADADVIISIRSADSYELDIVKECRRAGKLLIYYLDDDLLNIPQYAASTDYFNSNLVKNNIQFIMNQCDYLLTNNVKIKEKYEHYVQKDAYLIKAPALLLDKVNPRVPMYPTKASPIIIGFSGGIDHKTNIENFLENPLYRLKNKYGDKVEFEFMGARPEFRKKIPYKYIPYQSNYNNYISQMSKLKWDIALAPLPDSEFHACKYFNKYLEYGSIRAAGIYSDVDPYRQIIANNINGLLVSNTDEAWVEAISNLIDDDIVRMKIINEAHKQLQNEFTTPQIAKSIAVKLTELTSYQAPYCKPGNLKLNLGNKELLISKINNVVKSMGFKAPFYIAKKVIERIRKKE